jgi:peptide/nickel transport system substrate-binding protein/glutathione transport system substrate-binding protein
LLGQPSRIALQRDRNAASLLKHRVARRRRPWGEHVAVRRRYLTAVALALALFGAACGDDATPQTESPGATGATGTGATGGGGTTVAPSNVDTSAILKYGTMQAVSLDPVKQGTPCEVTQMRLIYDTLTQFDENNKLQPMLATSWTLDSPTQLTLKLRTDVKFQDGTPFNADAAKFNIDRVLSDPASNTKGLLSMVDSVAVVDPATISIKMKIAAGGPLLAALADRSGMMISPTAYKALGADGFNKAPVGSGMYKVQGDWRPVESLSVRSWDGYWDTKTPRIGGLDLSNLTVDSLVNALNSGAIDLATLSSTSQIPGVQGQPNTVVRVGPAPVPQLRTFLLNPTIPPLDNIKVRQAIAYALDRDAIADVMTDGKAKALYQWFPEGTLGYDSALATTYKYDPAKAKALLAEAGFPNGFDLKATIGVTSTSYIQQGELVQGMLKKVGINMTLDKIEVAQMVPSMYTGGPTGKGVINSGPWGSNLTPDLDSILRRQFLNDGATNNGGDEPAGLRALVDQAAAETDTAKRDALYKQVNKIITEDVREGIPLFVLPAIMAFKDYVGGITKTETGCPANIRGIYITQGKVPVKK